MSAAARGLFVDLDGTLADTLAACRDAYHGFLGGFGIAGDAAEFERLNGPPLRIIVQHLQAAHGLPGPVDALLHRYEALLCMRHAAAPVAAGGIDLLARARRQGLRIAVVTSAGRGAATAWLAQSGLAARIDALVSGDDVRRGKPDAEPYRAALAATGCAAAHSIAVEDSIAGVQSALAAGLSCYKLGAPLAALALNERFLGTVASLGDVSLTLGPAG